MTTQIQAIETVYKGYRFRSRLEARWAVFFDTLGVKYEYEKEGFELGDGLRYLPDFWLPDYDCWIEIKGAEPSESERQKAGLLAASANKYVDIFIGAPGDCEVKAFTSALPEHRLPNWGTYVDLAIGCGHWDVATALMAARRDVYWEDRIRRLLFVRDGDENYKYAPAYLLENASLKYYESQKYLELCPQCSRLLFGIPASVIPADVEGKWIVPEWHQPEMDTWCPQCEVEASREAPRLLAAYTAARQARFEFGEDGAPRRPYYTRH